MSLFWCAVLMQRRLKSNKERTTWEQGCENKNQEMPGREDQDHSGKKQTPKWFAPTQDKGFFPITGKLQCNNTINNKAAVLNGWLLQEMSTCPSMQGMRTSLQVTSSFPPLWRPQSSYMSVFSAATLPNAQLNGDRLMQHSWAALMLGNPPGTC